MRSTGVCWAGFFRVLAGVLCLSSAMYGASAFELNNFSVGCSDVEFMERMI